MKEGMRMKVLIACEESQEVCKAFRKRGHEAWSCDIQDCSGGHPEWHIKGNVIPIIHMGGVRFQTADGAWHEAPEEWDLVIAHPPCTYLTVSGNRHFSEEQYGAKALGRYMDRVDGIRFFMEFACCNSKRVAIENPIGIMSSVYRKPDQIIQPYQFGDPVRKGTCLWLRNLPPLKPTNVVEPKLVQYTCKSGKVATFSEHYVIGFEGDRAKHRSKTFHGIAEAMAEQWGGIE
jgi:hypothetical protein